MNAAAIRIELAPHCSLSPRGALVFFATVCAGCFGIAGLMTAVGFWPVLPFAGAEMALLAWALHRSMQRRNLRQTILVSEEEVRVQVREPRGARPPETRVFPRHWAQVKLSAASTSLHPSRLTIESHGRACEVGQFLTEEERRGVARRLARVIGRVSESPALPAAAAPAPGSSRSRVDSKVAN